MNRKRSLYLFPISDPAEVTNPYMDELNRSLNIHFQIVNEHDPTRIGIIQILKYLRKIDLVYLNWVEEISRRRFGVFQALFMIVLIRYLKIKRIKIIWTLHNLKSHYQKHRFLSDLIFQIMLKQSDLIITHAKAGLELTGNKPNSVFIHHPMRSVDYGEPLADTPKSDILIWGKIEKYKGVDSFLDFLKEKGVLQDFRIILAGKVSSEDLLEKLESFVILSDKITLYNEYVPEKLLVSMIRRTSLVVLTYHAESILSSGVLMDSLSQSARVIGPDTGAFKDLSELGLIDTFMDYPQLLDKVQHHLDPSTDRSEQEGLIKKFINENTWDGFSLMIFNLVEDLMQPVSMISR